MAYTRTVCDIPDMFASVEIEYGKYENTNIRRNLIIRYGPKEPKPAEKEEISFNFKSLLSGKNEEKKIFHRRFSTFRYRI